MAIAAKAAPSHAAPLRVDRMQGAMRAHGETTHTEHVLAYVARGALRMESGSELTLSAGSMGVVPAGVPHRALGGEGEWWTVAFCASCLGLHEAQVLMRPFHAVRAGAVPVIAVPRPRRAKVVGLFGQLEEESTRGAPESPELLRSSLVLLLGEVRRAAPDGDAVRPAGLVGDALTFIQRHALEPISLREVARAVHRTPSHVASAVKAATGSTVGDWIRAARVAEAANRLVHTDESLEEIANRVGWRDKTHFIRQFRKVNGVTPAAWRRAQRSGSSTTR